MRDLFLLGGRARETSNILQGICFHTGATDTCRAGHLAAPQACTMSAAVDSAPEQLWYLVLIICWRSCCSLLDFFVMNIIVKTMIKGLGLKGGGTLPDTEL